MRSQVYKLRQWLRTGLLPRLSGDKQVRYMAWNVPSETLADAVKRQGDHPAKMIALEWLAREPLLQEKFSLLDVGCGPGVLAGMIERHPALSRRISYTGIDQSEAALEWCRANFTGDFRFLNVNLQKDPLPGSYDVITINEVIEHLPHYREVINQVLDLKPGIFILTTFGVVPGLRRDRLRWNGKHANYMNSYSFDKLYEFLRSKTPHLWVADLGTQKFDRYWFPQKALLAFYLRLKEEKVVWTGQGWVKEP